MASRLSTSVVNPTGYYQLDRAAIREALDLLGIELDVSVRWLPSHNVKGGDHRCVEPYPGQHYIRLNKHLSPEQATHVLWHELAHAMQAELGAKATGQPAYEFYEIYIRSQGEKLGEEYVHNTFEIDARKWADHNKHKPLTKAG